MDPCTGDGARVGGSGVVEIRSGEEGRELLVVRAFGGAASCIGAEGEGGIAAGDSLRAGAGGAICAVAGVGAEGVSCTLIMIP